MPAQLEPVGRVRCTFEGCYQSFDTVKLMKRHKKYTDDHDYCHVCDKDFSDFASYTFHKITEPDKHGKACRVCGDEFKSEAGLKRHIDLSHKVDQRLTCIGCQESFYRACLFIEHLEFGHCEVISATQFQSHLIHKYLITEYMKGGDAYLRFQQKQAKYEAAIDCDTEDGGIELTDQVFGDEGIAEVEYEAIRPDEAPMTDTHVSPYPALPSQKRTAHATRSDVASKLGSMSLEGGSEYSGSTAVMSSTLANALESDSPSKVPSVQGSTNARSTHQPKAWGSRNGKSASSVLFPNAKPTPVTEEFSISAYDEQKDLERGPNMLQSHFWDPNGNDFEQERWFDTLISKYYCPFVCEQTFDTASDQRAHISEDHRITRMKCPTCLKYFKSATALMSHCESRGSRCEINKADDYNLFLDRLSGGFLAVQEQTRPDHLNNPSTLVTNADTRRLEPYTPVAASYLQYKVTPPPDWKPPVRSTTVGSGCMQQQQQQQKMRW
ncbi:hypothetical protein ACEQ8H_002462 [Pleosporales sp. CAS-2024a]